MDPIVILEALNLIDHRAQWLGESIPSVQGVPRNRRSETVPTFGVGSERRRAQEYLVCDRCTHSAKHSSRQRAVCARAGKCRWRPRKGCRAITSQPVAEVRVGRILKWISVRMLIFIGLIGRDLCRWRPSCACAKSRPIYVLSPSQSFQISRMISSKQLQMRRLARIWRLSKSEVLLTRGKTHVPSPRNLSEYVVFHQTQWTPRASMCFSSARHCSLFCSLTTNNRERTPAWGNYTLCHSDTGKMLQMLQ